MDSGLNPLAIIGATAVHQALGFLWYGPIFGETWLRAMGKTRDNVGEPGPAIAIAVAASLVTALALALFLSALDSVTIATGIIYGGIAGLGFVATSELTGAVFQERNRTVTAIYIGFQVLGLMIMGAILGAWG